MIDTVQRIIDTHTKQIANALVPVHYLAWDFAIRNIAAQVKKSLLADADVKEVVKHYFTDIAVKQFDFYFVNHIDTDLTHYSCAEGRACLKKHGQLRLQAEETLRLAGFTLAEIHLYELIAYLTHEKYQVDTKHSVESILLNDREQRRFQLLAVLCYKYKLSFGVELLTEVEQYMAVYKKHNDVLQAALDEQFFQAKEKTPWSRLLTWVYR